MEVRVTMKRPRLRGCLLYTSGIPASSVKLSIPADSLRQLPEGAVYRGKSGQANLTVGSDDSGNIVAEASCDSLQQLVLWLSLIHI